MPDFSRNTFMWIFVAIGVLILGTLIISSIIIYSQVVSVSNDVQKKLDDTNVLLTKLNDDLQGLDQLNEQLKVLETTILRIDSTVSSVPNNTQSLIDVKQELHTLAEIYPPNQTIVLNNIDRDNLNSIINNAVDMEFKKIEWKTNFNLILNIVFGSLLSLGGVTFAFYYIQKKKQ